MHNARGAAYNRCEGSGDAVYRRKTEKEIHCPLEYGLELFGGKWKSRIICVLAQKNTLRYGELRAELANITDAVLSAALKELISDGMALRRSYDEIPPRVEYSLTGKGRSAVPILEGICRWSTDYYDGRNGAACRECPENSASCQQRSQEQKN